jgi:methylthioribose-1-phosphate isomerase
LTVIAPVRWVDDRLVLLDQRELPVREIERPYARWEDVADAIRTLAVRGAPAIGVAAAFGVVLAAGQSRATTFEDLHGDLDVAIKGLAATRPTAVNLFWALDRMRRTVDGLSGHAPDAVRTRLLAEAQAILDEDLAANRAMGEHGATLVPDRARVLTHCNAGALATAGFGTALGVIRAAHAKGRIALVWVDETRPVMQGSRLTAWECVREGIPHRLIADVAAGSLMARGEVDMVVTGADRIAANGDTANKIGTYSVAVLAKHHGVPFYVAAPFSTIDPSLASGASIPIEERDAAEVRRVGTQQTAPEASPVFNPAFDVTPATLLTAIITERGVFKPPYRFADVGGPDMAPPTPHSLVSAPGNPGRPSNSRQS